MPALVTVNVEPRSSVGRELPGPRRLGEAADVGVELLDRARVAAAHDRDDEALLGLDGDAEVVAVELDDLARPRAARSARGTPAATARTP